jgi:hypothetical protein
LQRRKSQVLSFFVAQNESNRSGAELAYTIKE